MVSACSRLINVCRFTIFPLTAQYKSSRCEKSPFFLHLFREVDFSIPFNLIVLPEPMSRISMSRFDNSWINQSYSNGNHRSECKRMIFLKKCVDFFRAGAYAWKQNIVFQLKILIAEELGKNGLFHRQRHSSRFPGRFPCHIFSERGGICKKKP